ncbi:unnamed protein product [Penicillium salamii]|nr:unnamed protein product [Penicillium salamii]
MASQALDQHAEGDELVEVKPGNSPKQDELANSSDDDSDDELEEFRAMMASMKLDQVAVHTSQIRKSIQPDNQAEAFIVTEIGSPMFGSYNMLYPVIFGDGVRWLLRIPANGTRDQFDEGDAESLRSEALTMRLIRRETTIPLPEVFAFDNSFENQINCPFILISYIEGKKLSDVWHDKTSPKDIVQARRTRTLQDIAASMIQLDKFSFDKGGSLIFDQQDQLSGIGSLNPVDSADMHERLINEDPDESPIIIEQEPFSDPKAYYTSQLDLRGKKDDSFNTGATQFLRMFFELMKEPCDGRKPFVVAHPDFDIQNIIVSEDGELLGIIDWDGVSSVPRTVGNERYPGWLTRDWDPLMYSWNEDMEQGIKPDGRVWEDSPDALKLYRSVYASAMRSYQHNEAEPNTATLTTNSLIYENLYIAAAAPMCTPHIVIKVFEEIAAIVQADLEQRAELDIESENGEENFKVFSVLEAFGATVQSVLKALGAIVKSVLKALGATVQEERQAELDVESENGEEEFEVLSVLEALGENRLSEHCQKVLMDGIRKLVEGSAQL